MPKVSQDSPNATNIRRTLKWKLGTERYKDTLKVEYDDIKPTLNCLYYHSESTPCSKKLDFSGKFHSNILQNVTITTDQ